MTATRLELIKQHIDSFPVLPVTVSELMRLTQDPESSAEDIMKAILADQSLCFTILKIANSVLFGRPKKVDSLQLAIAVLGFNEVQNIAVTKALINSFNKINQQYSPFVDKFWEHSFLSAITSRIIAQDLRMALDAAYMAGLIHDIGKLIMLETFSDDYDIQRWLVNYTDERMIEAEYRTFSFTHGQVGGQLMHEWEFPDNLIAAVTHHHYPTEATDEKALAHIVQLADFLSFCCTNSLSLGDDNILTLVQDHLPNLQSNFGALGLTIDDRAVSRWFDWLSVNHSHANDIKSSFS